MRVIRSETGPDGLYTPQLAAATLNGEPPRVLRFVPASDGFRGTWTYTVGCGRFADAPPMQTTDTVLLRPTRTALVAGKSVAVQLEVTWATSYTVGAAARARLHAPVSQLDGHRRASSVVLTRRWRPAGTKQLGQRPDGDPAIGRSDRVQEPDSGGLGQDPAMFCVLGTMAALAAAPATLAQPG